MPIVLERLEVLRAISFLKHAIDSDDLNSAGSCLLVHVEQDRAILTAGDGVLYKKATLVRPITTVEAAKEGMKEKEERFMIPYSMLMAYESMVKEHKKKAKKLQKDDPNFTSLMVGPDTLESFGDEIQYKQPSFEWKDFEGRFRFGIQKDFSSDGLYFKPGRMTDAMAGFPKSKPVYQLCCGPDKPIYFFQKSSSFEALLYTCDEDDGKEDGGSEGDED